MTWTEMFITAFTLIGAAFSLAMALAILTSMWWYLLGKVRRAAYETYLLADMKLWMKRHGSPKESSDD